MSLVVPKPWSQSVVNTYNGLNSSTTGSINDHMTDERPLVRRTPRGRWRPPTPYYRTIWRGDVDCYNSTVFYSGEDPRWGPTGKYIYRVERAGAANASGYYATTIPSPPINMENQAIIKARLKLKGMKVNLPQAFAERGQTVRLVGDTLRTLKEMVVNVKRLKPGRFLRKDILSGDAFFNRWLELQYGWKPLLSDVYGAVSALHAHSLEAGPPIVTVKATVRSEDYKVTRLTDSANIIQYHFDRVEHIGHVGKIRLDFTQSDSMFSGTLAQLGITNPLELAWELLPWSFVADWFVPIGDYLSSLDATVGWQFKGGSYTVRTWQDIKANNFSVDTDPYIYRNVRKYAYGHGKGQRFQMTRSVYSSAPLPTLPSFHKLNQGSHMHVANGIALLMSAIVSGAGKVR